VHGGYVTLADTESAPASSARDAALARAKSGVGFSYYWGHGSWIPDGATPSTRGTCTGDCPNCTHAGRYGADCSGFAAKVWQVPSWNTSLTTDSHPYSTYHFYHSALSWSTVSRSNVKPADALVYNDGNSGHIAIYESGDGWGSMWVYEARGCAYGIVHNLRTFGSAYKAIARAGY
jgi:cell wall-associated NlpC family hydrolase